MSSVPGIYIANHVLFLPNDLRDDPYSNLTPANGNCTFGIHWIWAVMGQCVFDARGYASLFFGILCIVSWMINGLPQMIENCRSKIPDKALSPLFLLFWTIGDVTNLVGCLLTHQLFLQTGMAVYSMINDTILIFQYFYYKSINRKLDQGIDNNTPRPVNIRDLESTTVVGSTRPVDNASTSSNRGTASLLCFGASSLFCLAYFGPPTTMTNSLFLKTTGSSPSNSFTRRQLLSTDADAIHDSLSNSKYIVKPPMHYVGIDLLPGYLMKIGFVLGWISGIFYLCSRFPQVYKNWKRKQTTGLNIGLFLTAILGNVSYGLQIFLTSLDYIFLLRAMPWLFGSVGVLTMDLIILGQFFLYRRASVVQIPTDRSLEVPNDSDTIPIIDNTDS